MGFSIRFNWVLQIEPPGLLDVSGIYSFEKEGNRFFPLDTPIDLIDLKRNAIAKIKVMSFVNKAAITAGQYEVIKIYAGSEKQVLTNYWIENE